MLSSACLLWILAAVSVVSGQDDGQERLILKPVSNNPHIRPLGQTIMFTCEVTNGKDDVNYNIAWFDQNGKELSDSTSSRMYIEEDGPSKKLFITQILNSDAGSYQCRATINGVTEEKSTQLLIYKDITFDNAPNPQNPKIGTDALISCAVSGEPVPQVSWRHKGKRISFAHGGRYELQEKKGMIIKNITLADDGEYICRGEVNTDGRYSEKKITVKVHIPPTITSGPGRVDGIQGERASFQCRADGLPAPKYEFFKDGQAVHLQSSNSTIVDNDAGTVTFNSLSKTDEGQYRCKALNDVGEDAAVGHLHVQVRPEIFEFSNVTETKGGTATLICQSHGDPRPEMAIRKIGQETDYEEGENDGGRIVVSHTDNVLRLVIRNIAPADTADYVCKASSGIGSHEKTASLTVNYKPNFVDGQSNQAYTWAGRKSNISCQANGSPSPLLTWLRKDSALSNSETFKIYDMGSTSHLEIQVRENDQSWIYDKYVCRAVNRIGSSDLSIQLKRASAPSNPTAVNASKISPTSADLVVEPPEEDGGMPVFGYSVEVEKQVFDFNTTGQTLKLKNLKPNTTYTVAVKAKNEVGVSSPTDFTFTTEPTRNPYPVIIASESQGNKPHDYVIRWETPDTGGLPINEYEVKWRSVKAVGTNNTAIVSSWETITHKDSSKNPTVELQLKNLNEQTSYEVQILARNDRGWSDAHKPFIFSTAKATAASHERSSAPSLFNVKLTSLVSVVSWTLVCVSHLLRVC